MNYSPDTHEKLAIVANNMQMYGFKKTVRDVLLHVLEGVAPDTFDERHGVSTSGKVVALEEGEVADRKALDHAHRYQPTRERVMRHLLAYAQKRLDPREFTFLDLGCGKGRTLLIASELPFREVVGVDLSKPLCDAARLNGDRYRPSRGGPLAPIRVCCADATTFGPPPGNLLVYMFNPFGAPVLRAVFDRLAALQRERQCRVYLALSDQSFAYLLEDHAAFVQQQEFRVIRAGNSWSFWECRSEAKHAGARAAG